MNTRYARQALHAADQVVTMLFFTAPSAAIYLISWTNREDLIGTPASHGCIRLRNADIAELFDLVPEGTQVVIG
jgi:lipoprotein-anchoring transpeptidase ErfK/SrfK